MKTLIGNPESVDDGYGDRSFGYDENETLMAPKKFSKKYYILLDRAIDDLLKLFDINQNKLIDILKKKNVTTKTDH